jgi:tryptophan 2-C-methyltransferase
MPLKNRNILLVNPNRMRPQIGPLGLELVAEATARAGFNPIIADLSWEKSPIAALKKSIATSKPIAIGFSIRNLDDCYYASQAFILPVARRYVQVIKKITTVPIILGGVGFSIAPAQALNFTGADYGVVGDGENALPELLKSLGSGSDTAGIPGVMARGGKAATPTAADEFKDSEPSRNLVDLARYFKRGGQVNIETQRGCGKKCIYCADPVAKGRKARFRNPQLVAEEMERLARAGADVIHLCDSEFNLTRKHAESVAKAILKLGIEKKIRWYAYCLPKPMDNELALLLKRAGCAGIDFGADAMDHGMLERLGRDYEVPDLETCARAMKKADIPFMYDLLLGGPGETRRSLSNTIRRLKKIKPDRVGVSFGVRLFPGTRLARQVKAEGDMDRNPRVHGVTLRNDDLLRPVYYVSNRMGKWPEAYLRRLIDDDPAFLFAARDELGRDYNYNDNLPLCREIRRGARGAYWDILRRMK